MIDKLATGWAAHKLIEHFRKEDKVAPGSNEELRDNKNVGMEDGHIENHSFDLSTRDAINLMQQRKAEGKPVTGDDMKAIFKALSDSGQITREEWMDLREYVKENYNNLSPEAKAAFDKFDTAIQGAGNKVGWFDGKKDGATRNDAVFKGADLKAFIDSLESKPVQKEPDGVNGNPPASGHGGGGTSGGVGNSGGGVKPPENHAPSGSEGPSKAAGAPGPGASWGQIIAYIMGLINEKEKELKQRALDISKQIDTKSNGPKTEGEGTKTEGTKTEGEGTKTEGTGEAKADNSTKLLNTQLIQVQDEVKQLDQLTEMLTNLLSATHATTSKVVGNIR